MNNLLRKSIVLALTGSALGLMSSQAAALSAMPNLGAALTGTPIVQTGNAPKRSWSDYGTGQNFGWTHTAQFFTFSVGSGADITAGNQFDVNVTVAGNGATPLLFPGFSLWTSGSTPTVEPYSSGSGYGHAWSQVRGPYDGGNGGNPCSINCALGTNGWMATWGDSAGATNAPGNILSGHNGWIGYANSGYSFENGDGDLVKGRLAGATNPGNESQYWNGAYSSMSQVNDASPWVAGGGAALAAGSATLNLIGLKAGYYLIGLGGSCPDNNQNGQTCNNPSLSPGGTGFQLTIANVGATAVPVPAAALLFAPALSLLGLTGVRRKLKA